MVPYFRRNITLALSLVGLVVLAASFLLLANTHKPTPSVELGIAEHSPLGAEGGLVVPASCPSYDHTAGGGECAVCQPGFEYDINGVCQQTTAVLGQPSMHQPICTANGSQVEFIWDPVPASTGPLSSSVVYALRVDDPANNSGSCTDGWYCSNPPDQITDDYAGTNYTRSITPGKVYHWWVHAKYSGTWTGISGYTVLNVKCLAAPASMTATCNADKATVTLSWPASTGATVYYPRFKYPTTVTSCPAGWTLYTDNQTCYNNTTTGTSVTVPVSSGVTYDAWVHAADGGSASPATHVPGNAFTCSVPALTAPAISAPTCNAAGTQATFSWGTVIGATAYMPRVDDPAATCGTYPSYVNGVSNVGCINGQEYVGGNPGSNTGTSVTLNIQPNTTYNYWVHAGYANTWNGLSAAQSPLPSFSCPAGGSSTGSILVKRVGSDDTMTTAPAGTVAYIDGTSYAANPATASSLSTSATHSVSFSDVSGYTETAGTCTYTTGGTECSVTTFSLAPSCNGTTCSVPNTNVSANVTTKYAVKYTATVSTDPTITCSASSVTLGSSITGTVSGGSSANDWVGIYDPSGNMWGSQLLGTLTRPTNVTLSTNTNGGAGTWMLKVFKTGNNTTPTGTCSFSATAAPAATIDVQTVRVGSAQTTASVPPGTTSSLDGSAGDPTNPNVYSGVSAATHTASFTDLASYTETMGYCHYAPGSSCSVTTFGTLTPTCNGTTCSVTTPYQAGSYTRVAVMYTAVAGTRSISCSASAVVAGGTISGTETNGVSGDWMGMYAQGAADNSYVSGQALPPYTQSFTAPSTPGTYELRIWPSGASATTVKCSFTVTATPPATIDVQTVRVGSAQTTASVPPGTTSSLDGSAGDPTNPNVYSGVSAATHTASFTDLASYTETMGYCHYAPGSSCSVTTFGTLTPTCNGTTCSVTTPYQAGSYTRVAVMYTAVAGTGEVMIKRVGSDLTINTAPAGGQSALDNASWSQTNPYVYSGAAAGSHTANFSDISGYTAMAGTCTYTTGGSECSVSTFTTTPTCSGGVCAVPITVSSGVTTKVAVQYLQNPTGSILVKRVGSDLTVATAPSGTVAYVDGTSYTANPATAPSLSTSVTHTVAFTDVANYTETVGSCTFATGGAECSVTTFNLTPTCNGSTCTISPDTTVSSNVTTKYAVQYTSTAATPTCTISSNQTSASPGSSVTLTWTNSANTISASINSGANVSLNSSGPYTIPSNATIGSTVAYTMTPYSSTGTSGSCSTSVTVVSPTTPTCAITPSTTAVPYGGGYTSFTTSASNASYGYFNGAYMGTNLSTTQTPYVTSSGTQTMQVYNSSGVSASCSATVTVCASGQTVSNGACTSAATIDVQTVRVGSAQTTASVPPGTTSSLDGSAGDPTNPNVYSGVSAATHTASFTDLASYTETMGYCHYAPGSSCSVTTFGTLTPTCNGTTCSVTTPYQAGSYTRVAVMYTLSSTSNPTCTLSPSTTAVPYGGGYASFTTSASNASYGYFNGAYIGTNLSTTQTPYITSSGTQTMTVWNSMGTVSGSCSATVTVCASGQTVSNGACVSSTPAPTCTITASPTSTTSGGSVTLTKTSSDATSATLNGVATATSGTSTVNPTTTTTYTMDVSGAGGSGSCSTTVTVGSSGSGISCSAPSVTPGGSISGTVSGGSSASDWVSVFAASEPANSMNYFASGASPAYQFVSLPRPQIVTFTAPSTAGSYELRAQSNGSYTTFASCPFTVGSSGSCPAGYGGTYPNCTCPAGYTGTYPSCTPSSTGAVMIKRVDSNSNVLSTATASYVDSTAGSTTVNPSTFSSLSQGAHTAYFGDLSGYTETLGTCQFATGGTECTVSSFPTTPTCGAGICSTPVTVTAGQTTKIAVRYVGATTGDIMIKRVDAALNLFSGTAAYVDGTPSGSNPATFSSLSTSGTHSASFTDAGGYTEQVGTCAYVTGGTECTVSTFPTTPSCASGVCSLPAFAVTSGQTTKVVVQYTAIGNPVIDLHIQDPGSIRVHSGDSVTVVWNVTNGAGWTGVLTGPGVSGGGLSGSVTKVITAQSIFTLTLTPPSGSGLSPVTKSLTVSLIPAGSEI